MITSRLDIVVVLITRFFSWWARELVSVFPKRLREKLFSPTNAVDIYLSTDSPSENELNNLVFGQYVTLHLSDSHVLTHKIVLPKADYKNTKAMVALQLARVMPLDMSALYTHWCVAKQKTFANEEKQTINLYAIKRSFIDPFFQRVFQKRLLINTITLEGLGNLSGFLPHAVMRPLYFQRLNKMAFATFVMCGLLSLPYAWYWNIASENKAIEKKLNNLRGALSQLSALRHQLDQYQSRKKFIETKKMAGQLRSTLALLSAQSPDTVWLKEFTYEPQSVRVAGYATSAAEWALTLEKLKRVERVQLQIVSAGLAATDPESFTMDIKLARRLRSD